MTFLQQADTSCRAVIKRKYVLHMWFSVQTWYEVAKEIKTLCIIDGMYTEGGKTFDAITCNNSYLLSTGHI